MKNIPRNVVRLTLIPYFAISLLMGYESLSVFGLFKRYPFAAH